MTALLRTALLLVVLIGLTGNIGQRIVVSEETFRDEVIAQLLIALPGGRVTSDGPLSIVETRSGANGATGETLTHNIADAYRAYADRPEAMEQVITDLVKTIAAPAHQLAKRSAKELVLAVRTQTFAADLTPGPDGPPQVDPLGGDLVLLYGFASDATLAFVTGAALEAAGIAPDKAREIASKNMVGLTGRITVEQVQPGLWGLAAEKGNEETLAASPGFWQKIARFIEGTPVFAVPAPNVLVFARAEDPAGLEALRTFALNVVDQVEAPISFSLYTANAAGAVSAFKGP